MKFYVIYFLFMLVFGINSVNSQIINKWENVYKEKGSFNDWYRQNNLQSLDKDNILLIDQIFANTAPFLAVTNNGGLKWDTIYKANSFEYEINAIAYPCKNNIVWVGDSTVYQGNDGGFNDYYLKSGVIFTSTNAGQNWTKIKFDTNTVLDYVAMFDANTGIANLRRFSNKYNEDLSYYDTLIYTTDFFNTYSKIHVPDSLTFVEKIYIFSQDNFIIRTWNGSLKKYKYLETTDRGITWTEFMDAYSTHDLFFVNRLIAYKIEDEATDNPNIWLSKIYKTIDGGKNWVYCFTPTDAYWADYRVIRIAASDADNAIAVGTNCAIYRTEDGGKNWLKEFAPNTPNGGYDLEYDDLFYITYPEKNVAYLTGGDYVLKMTGEKTLSRPILNRYSGRISPVDIKAFWKPVIGAKKYQLQITNAGADNTYDTKKFENLVYDASITDTLVTLPEMDYDSCYYARIKAVNDEMESGWNVKASMFCTFLSADYTMPPTFIYPKPGAKINTLSCEFKWSSVAGAEEYQLQFCDNPYFMGTISDQQHLIDTIFKSDDLVYGVTYKARVKVTKGAKITEWAYTSFTLVDPSSVINIDMGDNNNISIYPNPASDFIIIQASEGLAEGSDIQIFDMMGINVSPAGRGIKGGGKIDISNLSPGMYFIKTGNKVSKFVKR